MNKLEKTELVKQTDDMMVETVKILAHAAKLYGRKSISLPREVVDVLTERGLIEAPAKGWGDLKFDGLVIEPKGTILDSLIRMEKGEEDCFGDVEDVEMADTVEGALDLMKRDIRQQAEENKASKTAVAWGRLMVEIMPVFTKALHDEFVEHNTEPHVIGGAMSQVVANILVASIWQLSGGNRSTPAERKKVYDSFMKVVASHMRGKFDGEGVNQVGYGKVDGSRRGK